MNRLVIIGNGFDLAHGLPTSYRNFIDDLWFRISQNPQEYRELVEIDNQRYNFMKGKINNYSDFLQNIEEYRDRVQNNLKEVAWDADGAYVLYYSQNIKNYFFRFINDFFQTICKNSIENWVDIENEYYKKLIYIVNKNELSVNLERTTNAKKKDMIKKLNFEFDQVKCLLEKYLIEKVEEDYVFSRDKVEEFLDIFQKKEYKGYDLECFLKEISKNAERKLFKDYAEHLNSIKPSKGYYPPEDVIHKVIVRPCFLSFNYTSTVSEYVKLLDLSPYNLNEIHGRLEDVRNPINFGFGDEMDKYYQEIEDKVDNEYLRNIKSFQYLHTSNYRHLLDLIDSQDFQVYIMGHSCGLSDRTMLNTIFEHPNCISIKIFYHQKKDGTDNYTEIIQNISRHFNDKKLMRSKIVNKTLCQALPQINLPRIE